MATRRDFLKSATAAMAGALVSSGCGSSSSDPATAGQGGSAPTNRPNILLVVVDEMRIPPPGYAPNQGEVPGIKEILGFQPTLSADNPFARFFPAYLRLRKNSVVLRNHYCSAAACSPSRTTFITGQYPSLHGVTQVNGSFKVPDEIQFLDPNGVPTLGDWFRAAGYETHYFGKWHVSNTSKPPYDLEPYGFSSYQTSGPDPDSSIPNLGAYRDPGFSDIISNFFNEKGKDRSRPWFAVASFTNPHDTGAYPSPFYLPAGQGVTSPLSGKQTPQAVPPQGAVSNTNSNGVTVALNPDGFPQSTFELPPTYNEDLSTKPDCHLDSAWKVSMALAAAFPPAFQDAELPYPLQALPSPLKEDWARAFGQFYIYLQYLVNLDMNRALQALDNAGLSDDTIIIFTSDHGSNTMAHGLMLQKFHTAYEEALRVPFVVSGKRVNASDQMKEMVQPTTHVDLAPTLLGLAGLSNDEISALKPRIRNQTQVRDFVGLNLAPYILSQESPLPRPGVLFTTSDEVTRLAEGVPRSENQVNYDNFVQRVQRFIDQGAPLFPGSCVEPNTVHMLRTQDWKYTRYLDDNGVQPDQYEFYYLAGDPNETFNLVDYKTGQLRPNAQVPNLTTQQLQAQLDLMKAQLAEQENKLLLTPV